MANHPTSPSLHSKLLAKWIRIQVIQLVYYSLTSPVPTIPVSHCVYKVI